MAADGSGPRMGIDAELLPRPGDDGPAIAAALRRAGLLQACAPQRCGGAGLAHRPSDPASLAETLSAVGRADLSAGRLFEGHVNAAKLLILHGGTAQEAALHGIARGAFWGVWGADGPDPVRIEGKTLRGAKLYASGADILDGAIVTARDTEGRQRLLALPRALLEGRLHPGEWRMSGMQATASGRCDLDGILLSEAHDLGPPDAYMREPYFHGGVWRYAAVQLGAMRALTEIAARGLEARGHAQAPLQSQRLRRMVMACETARLWIDRAAQETEHPDATPDAADTSILARLATAEAAVLVMTLFDEALGAASFAQSHPGERIRRDLGLYLRQANPDGLGEAAMTRILAAPAQRAKWHLE